MPSRLTFALILACVAVFFVERLTGKFGQMIFQYGMLSFTDGVGLKQPWRWITYQYLHADGWHLFFNILSVYFFIWPLERLWGWRRTLAFYTIGGIVAGATFGMVNLLVPSMGLIGASGSIFAVLGALAVLVPDMQVLAQMVIPITMRTLVLLYTVLFVFTVIGDRNPSDAAHLGGLAFGFFTVRFGGHVWQRLTWRLRSTALRRQRRRLLREQEIVDQILQKVSRSGMHSLSWWEKRTLRKATEHQRRRDEELSRSRF